MDKPLEDRNPLVEDAQPMVIDKNDESSNGWTGARFIHICCDCGLTHDAAIVYNSETNQIMFATARDDRSTAQYRRYGNAQLISDGIGKWCMVRKSTNGKE